MLVGTVGFALLQRWGREETRQELRESGVEETVWDIVNDNERRNSGTPRHHLINDANGDQDFDMPEGAKQQVDVLYEDDNASRVLGASSRLHSAERDVSYSGEAFREPTRKSA